MEEQQQQPQQEKRPLSLDWNALIDGDEAPPAELVVKSSVMTSDQEPPVFIEGLDRLKDYELEEQIRRKKKLLETSGKKLPDGGAKLRAMVKRYEEEFNSRKSNPRPQKVDEEQKPVQATSSGAVGEGVANDLRQECLPSRPQSQPSFATCFYKKIEDNTNCAAVDAFSEEMPHFKQCKNANNQTVSHNGEHKRRKRHRRSSSRHLPYKCPSKPSKRDTSDDDKSCRANSTLSVRTIKMNLSRRLSKEKGASQEIQSDCSRSRKGQPIVLDDDDDDDEEEDPHVLEKTEYKVPEYLKEAKTYFPSRDDPESVEICYNDMECLAPEGYLTSTIMNFYIRYLQQQVSPTISDYHFFNTYFYKKLKEAVSCKESNRETIFAKFRRWWKGVNIFQKAYVLIPIHQDLHWSLIIICIPDKEDESGPIILHLDSLGLHSSRSVFNNIRSYLIEERNYLSRECASSDVPIADRIWKCLSRRIETQAIAVPQQKNEYDCGLFVLYFIERFMEEAPERLRKKDLAMFGKRWFKPEEASSLRVKIKKLLVAELHNSIRHDDGMSESSPSSTAPATECVETAKDDSLINDGVVKCNPDIIE
ncbi:ubiquitin-like-specific protease 1D isoform X2 [Cicer arietinum]|uniref:Ubiquitin-like-specific protease 1D isoform X2 n=1 Tax=Cicer arietinum TaxID=3827 RepID=A0A1S2YTU8_CICAR|nr:ubiquitin-like-specific protease 1D isoform X2 [Cicer arietinum]